MKKKAKHLKSEYAFGGRIQFISGNKLSLSEAKIYN